MKNKLRSYIDGLFEDAPKTRKAYELREELLANLNAKYDDLINRGYSEEEAYQAAVAGIGDVSELINALYDKSFNSEQSEKERKMSALLISVGVMLYIVAILPVIILHSVAGVVLMFVIAAIATGMLVYNAMSRPRYNRADETLVEEFKEWKSANSNKLRLQKSVTSAMWSIIVVLYFFISFYFGAWAYSWIIFILGGAFQNIIRIIFDMKE